MSEIQIFAPCLLADGVLLANSLDVVAPEIMSALDPIPGGRRFDGLVGEWGSGPSMAAQLDSMGITPAVARQELAVALELAQAAYAGLPERTRRRLAWPPRAERLTTDRWLLSYAAEPARWLLDLAGGLTPAMLLRCCLIARPLSRVELWLEPELVESARVPYAEPHPAPVAAQSARGLLFRADPESVEQRGQQA